MADELSVLRASLRGAAKLLVRRPTRAFGVMFWIAILMGMDATKAQSTICSTCGAELEAGGVPWPAAIAVRERLPAAGALVFVWKPMIDGWDIVLGREVIKAPELFTHWRPMMPRPE